jgi:hypothetical protein
MVCSVEKNDKKTPARKAARKTVVSMSVAKEKTPEQNVPRDERQRYIELAGEEEECERMEVDFD